MIVDFKRISRRGWGMLFAAMILTGLTAVRAQAATTWTVNTTDDSDDGSCGGTCSLRDAITAANADSGDTIQFDSSLVGGTITVGSTLTITSSMTITGPGANFLTISGGNAARVFEIDAGTVSISGLTVAEGFVFDFGGGILSYSTLTVNNCAFSGNTGYSSGGSGAAGGAIINFAGVMTVTNSTFSGNSAYQAGAILNYEGNLTVGNSTFSGNSADQGGAIFQELGSTTVTNSTFSGNTAATTDGAIDIFNGTFTVTNSILSGDTGGECSGSGCPTNGSNGNVVGGTVGLTPLDWYGGTTQTMVPLPGSSAILAGTVTASDNPSTDQRGFARSSTTGATIDAGAVQTNFLIVTTLTDQVDGSPDCTSGTGSTCSLRDAVTLAGTSPNTNGADITFASGLTGTIDLSTVNTSLTHIAGDLNLMGPGARSLTISGGGSSNVGTLFLVSSGQMTISGVTLANAHATGVGGTFDNHGALTLSKVWVSNNLCLDNGGGIYQNSGSLYVVNSTFSGNSTSFDGAGGGIALQSGLGVVANSTFYGNTGYLEGGGIFANGAQVGISNSTFVANSTDHGDVSLSPSGTIMNSIVAVCYNFTCTNGVDGNVVGVGANVSALGYHGGPVPTLMPLPGSVAICAGLPALDAGVPADQRGFARLNTTYPGYSLGYPCADAGAVQTNYQSLQFLQTGYSGLPGGPIDTPTQPVVTITENNQNLGDVPITLSISGTPTYTSGLGPVSTVAGAGATFDSLIVSPGTDYTLSTSMNVLSGLTLSTSADLSIANIPVTTSAIIAPTITYGSAAQVTVTVNSTGGTPTGNVSLSVAGGSPMTQALSGGATTFTVTGLNAGPFSLSSSYLPQNGFGGSYATGGLLVNKAVPTFSGLSSPTITAASSPTAISGTLNANAGLQLVPSGESVTISVNAVSVGAALNGSDQFSGNLTTSAVDPGINTINFSYPGDSNFFPATGTGTLTVTPASTCTVTDNADDPTDTVSLRYCVNNASNGTQINFNTPLTGGNTITLNSANGPLAITKNITIAGPGSNLLTISGGNAVGVFTENSSVTATISGLTISNGSAVDGGGISSSFDTLTVANCTFTGNHASSDGGAIYTNEIPGLLTVTNSTFTNNTATSRGGAINAQGTFTISGSTFTGNSAASGGGVYTSGVDQPYTVESSTIWGNTATSGADLFENFNLTAFNDVLQTCNGRGSAPFCPKNGVNGNYVGSAPNLAPLGWYGGSTQTMPPLPGSPVICTGSTSNLDAFVSTDQRGFARMNTTYTGYSGTNPCLDAGAVQTNYQSIQFDSGTYTGSPGQAVNPAPVVSVTESGQSMGGIPVTLGFSGTAPTTSSGLGPVTTVAGTGAEFDSLVASPLGTYTLTTALTVVGSDSISNTATLNIGASPTISTTPSNTAVTLGSVGATLKDSATLAGGSSPTGTITFTLYQGSNPVDTETVTVSGNGTYSTPTGYTLPSIGPVAGTYQWNASYSGDANNNSASETNNASEQVTVSPASPTVNTTASPAVTLGSGSSTLSDSATLSGGANPTGNIVFKLYSPGNNIVDTEPVSVNGNGTYSTPTGYTLPSIGVAAGTYTWKVTYNGDANNNSAQDQGGTAEQTTVSAASPTLSTSASPGVTLGAGAPPLRDMATLSLGANPTGTITFTLYSPGNNIVDTEFATVSGNGTYSTPTGYTLPSIGVVAGTYTWKAAYSGDSNNNTAQDQGGTGEQVTVSPASPAISTAATPGGTLGSRLPPLRDMATLSAGANPTGTITFTLYLGATLVDTETVSVSGNGSYSTPTGYTLPTVGTVTGTYQWNAAYNGDANNNAVSEINNSSERITVSAASPTISTTPNTTNITLGGTPQMLRDSATLSFGASPTGTITFTLYVGSTLLDTETVTVSGNGIYSTPTGFSATSTGAVAGTYQWNAAYNGDPNNNSTSENNNSGEQVVVQAPPPLTITAASPSMVYGASVPTIVPLYTYGSFTNTTTPPAGLTTAPSCSAPGVTNTTAVGSYPTSCSGAVDANYTIGYATGSLTVNAAGTSTSITTHTPNPSVTGQSVTVNYSVTASSPSTATPVGSVTVSDGIGDTCSASVATGHCSLTFTQAGGKSLTASFTPGNGNFTGSSSGSVSQTVNKAATKTQITPLPPSTASINTPVTIDFTVTAVSPGSGTPTGNVTVSDPQGDTCTAGVATGSCQITFHSTGKKTLTAKYAGDGNFNSSASAASNVNQTPSVTITNP